jgi:glycosyltransferase involved in cell wall biosynthesis
MTSADNPLVTVIIPSFNSEQYIGETLQSVLDQTYRPLEVIAVDDGSTDRSPAILRSYGTAVRVVRQPNQGRSVARNRGLDEAFGEYVVFLDSDDLLAPTHVATLVDVLQQTECDIAYGKSDHFITGRPSRRFPMRVQYHELGEAWRIVLHDFIPIHAAVVRRRFLLDSGVLFTPGRECGEDWEFWIRLVLAGAHVRFVNQVVARRREHDTNTTRDLVAMDRQILTVLTEIESSHRTARGPRLTRYFERSRVRVQFRLASALVFLGRRTEGRRMLAALVPSFLHLRPVDLARLPCVVLFSCVPVRLGIQATRVFFGQHCALHQRLSQ